ncbi:MAG: type II toxin-antitoxin system HicB family antitoxin [Sphingomonas sp.]
MQVTAVLTAEDDGYVSDNPETGVASQVDTIEGALTNLREAAQLWIGDQSMPSGRAPFVTQITITERA